jgi:alkylation response protein AidB-like acyl-CoA dehydrogenase
MSQASTQSAPPPQPLVSLTEDEVLFRDNVRQFADQALRPKVREMDEKGVFDHDLIDQFFHLGLMGIEVPEQYGGAGESSLRPFWRWRRFPASMPRPG